MSKPTPASFLNAAQQLENQVCFPRYAASRLLTKVYQPYLQELELTYPQYLVLLLWEHRELTMKALGNHLRFDSGTLTSLLKRIELKQWLRHRRDLSDEHSVLIRLLPAGRALHQRARHIPAKILEKLTLTPAEFTALRQQLRQLLTRLA